MVFFLTLYLPWGILSATTHTSKSSKDAIPKKRTTFDSREVKNGTKHFALFVCILSMEGNQTFQNMELSDIPIGSLISFMHDYFSRLGLFLQVQGACVFGMWNPKK